MNSEKGREFSEADELDEFFTLVDPALNAIMERFGGTEIEALQTYLLLGVVSELKMIRSEISAGSGFPMGALSREDVELFMETIGAKPN